MFVMRERLYAHPVYQQKQPTSPIFRYTVIKHASAQYVNLLCEIMYSYLNFKLFKYIFCCRLILFNNVIHVFLLTWLCIFILCLCMATPTKVFPCFFLSCKANARVKPANTGHGRALFLVVVLFCLLFVLRRSLYCLCVYVYCTTATGWLPNCSYIYRIVLYLIICVCLQRSDIKLCS
jgi:hypothetical protein